MAFAAVWMLLSVSGFAQEILVSIHLPPAGQFTTEDIFHAVHLTNPGPAAVEVYMHAKVSHLQKGNLIFEGETSIFPVVPGTVVASPDLVSGLEKIYSDPEYEGMLLQTGSVPAGIYVICIEVFHGISGEMLSRDCIDHEVFHPSMPQLLMPADAAAITEEYPLFNWIPPMPVPAGQIITYRLRMVEVHGWQSPLEAMEANPAWFTGENIMGNIFAYPADARPLEPGRLYAWQVQAFGNNGLPLGENDGHSEIFVLSRETFADRYLRVISPVAFCAGSITGDGYHADDQLVVNCQYSGNFTSLRLIVYDNPCGRYPGPPDTPTPPPGTPTPPPVPPGKQPVPTGRRGQPETPTTPVPVPGGKVTPVTGTPVTDQPVPADTGLGGTDSLPPLPPGWKWGEAGPYWTGEEPPEPPALPPGWEWGPLRPVWTGEGEPPPRNVRGVSQPLLIAPVTIPDGMPVAESLTIDLREILQPGEAFIYQVFGTGEEPDGEPFAILSESQCMRYMPVTADDPAPVPAPCPDAFFCNVRTELKADPRMDGGLDPPTQEHNIYRDEFVPLKADGKDIDQLWWHCDPIKPCPDTHSTEMTNLSSRVRYTWEIIKGEGDFVELGISGKKRNEQGIRTIFMPPYAEVDSLKETEIKLTIIDDNPTQPLDSNVVRIIKVSTRRLKSDPDKYNIKIESDPYRLPQPVQITGLPSGTCMRRGPKWDQDKDLKNPPDITLPKVDDSDKVVFQEWIRLEAANPGDPDLVKLWCESQNCQTNEVTLTFQDEVEWTWTILKGGGRFVTGSNGRFVIYEAPEQAGEVEIQVEAYNNSSLQIVDQKTPPAKIKLKVYQPGVKMELTPLNWLPDYKNVVQKKSWLVHKDGTEWKPALSHQGRIHFIEFTEYSTLPGICMNWPPSERSDRCPDLSVKKLETYEVYDSLRCKKWNTTDSTYFLKVRSKLPQKEQSITLVCEDYGAYGLVRSIANGSKSVSSPYLSVPWEKAEVPHPEGREKKNRHPDNRVSVPRDCDENKIADNGWTSGYQNIVNSVFASFGVPAVREKDPADPLTDTDRLPASNNDGDGLSAYEEYRGFKVKGTHTRTGTLHKDLFIHDRDNITVGNFGTTGILTYLIHRDEFTRARVINFNHGASGVIHQGFLQHGLLLVDASADTTMRNLYGIAAGGPGSPGRIDSVKINVTLNRNNGRPLGRSIAHELSHGVDVWHHGRGYIRGFLEPGDSVIVDGVWELNTSDRNWNYTIACQRGVLSGDVDCWMRYTHRYCAISPELTALDCSIGGHRHNLKELELVLQAAVFGDRITDHFAGTGVNAGGQCGADAANLQVGSHASNRSGICASQIKVTDR